MPFVTGDEPYSRTQVKKAGKILRRAWTQPRPLDGEEVAWAEHVLDVWRRQHSAPLNAATMALRARLVTVGVEGDVAQRLKRRVTIIDKLVRRPDL